MKTKNKNRILLIIGIVLFVISAAFIFYPSISNAINSYFNDSVIVNYNEKTNNLTAADKADLLSAAEKYNNSINDKVSEFCYSTTSILNGYDDVLNFDDGIIGYIKINKINVNLPIYHGSSDNSNEALTKGAIHLPNTAFPIGGLGNHSVISAHTGYPTQVFFDNLTELENGDIINIYVLDDCLTYKVTDINIVDPDDINLIQADENRDLLSLITCYPYGINSHRLIVTAERYEETNNKSTPDTSDEIINKQINSDIKYSAILIIVAVLPLSVIIYIVANIFYKKRRQVTNDK